MNRAGELIQVDPRGSCRARAGCSLNLASNMLLMLVGYSTHTTGSPATVFNAEALAEVVEDEGRTNVAAPCETDSSRSHGPLLAGAVWVIVATTLRRRGSLWSQPEGQIGALETSRLTSNRASLS